ncbi:glutathione S-transferase domain-containing protein [Tieghemostelium lacteum]|uniref:Glutathione S-transferase domain-containing protein n=1 Tax=Tieghemostelium lacteum TaxID=361077 RepID=A0A151Z3K6_TIELA|nr:glutathione S-transferase domain-containing protein [Tieghemostelium lacteum]|eukprot:KYQ88531.1 glutathione S-transferase domain-containing protein [Tieghemostelium lacteum]
MSMKIFSYPKNKRVFKALIAAKYVGVDIEVPAFNFGVDNKTPEFLKMNPLGKIPVLQTAEGAIFESNAIVRYVARLGKANIYGKNAFENGVNDQWIDFATNEIDTTAASWLYPILGFIPFIAKETQKAKENMKKILTVLDNVLLSKPFLTGYRIALADIVVVCSLLSFYEMVFEPAFVSSFANVNRYFKTCINQPEFKSVIGEVNFCQKMMEPPKKEKEEKKVEPKKEQPKKEEKPVTEGDDEEFVEKKKKNPLDDLPPTTFNLDEFKRTYSNNEVSMSIPWFWSNFDASGFSIWFADYKYNEELEQLFKTANLVGGFFQRLETLHKYAFSSMIIFGEQAEGGKINNQSVSGVWVFRGQEIPPDMLDCDDSLVYNWTKLNPTVEADKEKINEYFAWEGKFGGNKKFLQGKLYK